MPTADDVKRLYATARAAKEATDDAIRDESIEESEFDAILDAECEANDKLIDALVDFGRGMLCRDDAETVVLRRFDEVGNLVGRLAS